ncbi:hypothetical protein [Moraxella lacunata]|uniref:hypothetical protein n=1 Tax=Moraxella lacunata TaxID=477 RepID=UPI003EE1E0B3
MKATWLAMKALPPMKFAVLVVYNPTTTKKSGQCSGFFGFWGYYLPSDDDHFFK